MSASIALGHDFMGFKTNTSKCLILSCEDDLDEVHRRLDRMCKAHEWRFQDFKNNLVFCCRAGSDNLFIEYVAHGKTSTKTGFFNAFIKTIKNENFEFVVIDNIANVYGGNENDRSETTRFMNAIYELCVSANISILLLEQPPKGAATYSGSTAWEAAIRQRFNLKKDNNGLYILKCEKANYIRVGEEVEMAKNDDGVFVETFSLDTGEDDFDFEGLKVQIWNFVKECNESSISISFAHQAGSDYYEKKLRFKGLTKGHKIKDIHLSTMHHSIKEFSERTAMNLRAQALAFDILARDMRRQIRAIEEQKKNKPTKPKMPPPEEMPVLEDRLYVRVKEACKIMGMGHTALYNEINEGRLPIKKAGRKTLIEVVSVLRPALRRS